MDFPNHNNSSGFLENTQHGLKHAAFQKTRCIYFLLKTYLTDKNHHKLEVSFKTLSRTNSIASSRSYPVQSPIRKRVFPQKAFTTAHNTPSELRTFLSFLQSLSWSPWANSNASVWCPSRWVNMGGQLSFWLHSVSSQALWFSEKVVASI